MTGLWKKQVDSQDIGERCRHGFSEFSSARYIFINITYHLLITIIFMMLMSNLQQFPN